MALVVSVTKVLIYTTEPKTPLVVLGMKLAIFIKMANSSQEVYSLVTVWWQMETEPILIRQQHNIRI